MWRSCERVESLHIYCDSGFYYWRSMDHHCNQFPISLIQDNCIEAHQHNSYIEDYDELLSKITLTRTNCPIVGLFSSPCPSPLLRFLRFLSCLFFLLSIILSIFLPFPFPQIYSSFVFIMFLLFLLVFKLIFYSSHIETLCPLATSSHISNPFLQISWSHH